MGRIFHQLGTTAHLLSVGRIDNHGHGRNLALNHDGLVALGPVRVLPLAQGFNRHAINGKITRGRLGRFTHQGTLVQFVTINHHRLVTGHENIC